VDGVVSALMLRIVIAVTNVRRGGSSFWRSRTRPSPAKLRLTRGSPLRHKRSQITPVGPSRPRHG
jgi:hypothetical protein